MSSPASTPSLSLPSGLVTFVFTDIVSSSEIKNRMDGRTSAARDAAYCTQIKAPHDLILKERILAHGGCIVKEIGDSFFAAFADAEEAVLCCLEIQQAITAAAIATPLGPLCIRVGINSGQASPASNDYTGAAVDKAARIQSSAQPGQVCLSTEAHGLVSGKIRDVCIRSDDFHDLKGVGRCELFVASFGDDAEQRAQALLDRYLKSLLARFGEYENLGLPTSRFSPDENDAPIEICDLFVHPTACQRHLAPEAFNELLNTGKPDVFPLLPLLAKSASRTVVLADPGMGKSTLTQWLIASLAARKPFIGELEPLTGAIPFPFILRDLVPMLPPDHKTWSWTTLLDAFRRYRPGSRFAPTLAAALTASPSDFERLLDSPHAFFLVDGLDEISDPDRRAALRNVLWEGFGLYKNSRWLVTSRLVGYEQAAVDVERIEVENGIAVLTGTGKTRLAQIYEQRTGIDGRLAPEITSKQPVTIPHADLLYLAPFDDAQQRQFAHHWYLPRLGPTKGPERADLFLEAIRQHRYTRTIGRIPNLLYLLALLFRHKAHLPNGRALVYADIAKAYLEGIDLDKGLGNPYTLENKIRLLSTIGLQMQRRRTEAANKQSDEAHEFAHGGVFFAKAPPSEILVTTAELSQWLASDFQDAPPGTLKKFLDHIADRSGLLLPRGQPDGQEHYAFAHLSFQEYFAACALEGEFRTLNNSTTGQDLFGNPVAAPATTYRREDYADLAANPAWSETFVFLLESLRGSPSETTTLLGWLFPQLKEEIPTERGQDGIVPEWMPLPAAQLLAALSLDPEINLTPPVRQGIWTKLWQAHLAQQEKSIWGRANWLIAPSLLAPGPHQTAILQTVCAIQPEILSLRDCVGITDLAPLKDMTSLQTLSLHGCAGIADFTPLKDMTSLQWLSLTRCVGITDLAPLKGLASLHLLSLHGCFEIANLAPLNGLTRLQTLSLHGCARIADLAPLKSMTSLERLSLFGCAGIRDLSPLKAMANLQRLSLFDCAGITDLAPLKSMNSLQMLDLSGCTRITDLDPLNGMSRMQEFNLSDCAGIRDLTPLKEMTSLQMLDLSGCAGITDLDPLNGMTSMREINLSDCVGIRDLAPLKGMNGLWVLDLRRCTGITDIYALKGITGLETLDLTGCAGLRQSEEEIRRMLPEGCTIIGL